MPHYHINFKEYLSPSDTMPEPIRNAFTDLLTDCVMNGTYAITPDRTYPITKQNYSFTVTVQQPVAITSSQDGKGQTWGVFPCSQPLCKKEEEGTFAVMYASDVHYTLMKTEANGMILVFDKPSKETERAVKNISLTHTKKGTPLTEEEKKMYLIRLQNEAKLGGRIKKLKTEPLILTPDKTQGFLVMAKQPGIQVFDFINDNMSKFLDNDTFFLEFMRQLLQTYKEDIADNKFLHHDIKPENIMVNYDPQTGQFNFSFVDCGFAMEITDSTEGMAFGSRQYVPPEAIFRQKRTIASDLYSLCRIFVGVLGVSLCHENNYGKLVSDYDYSELLKHSKLPDTIKEPLKMQLLAGLQDDPKFRPELNYFIKRTEGLIAKHNELTKKEKEVKAALEKQKQTTEQLTPGVVTNNKEEVQPQKVSPISMFKPIPEEQGLAQPTFSYFSLGYWFGGSE